MAGFGSQSSKGKSVRASVDEVKMSTKGFEKMGSGDTCHESEPLLSRNKDVNGTYGDPDPQTPKATFERLGKSSYYEPVEGYEGSHRYDPQFRWEPNEEKRLVRKVCISFRRN